MFRRTKRSAKKSVVPNQSFSEKLEENVSFFTNLYEQSTDVVFHSVSIGNRQATIIYI
ncbi:hypothetical protein [Oceanobacillus luteolus]|uniref:Uncharacterized protein n=2 Tax=Oceanobacillus luteolus TaxID=1274358 RepID=A0ABW4HWK3_9BACI